MKKKKWSVLFAGVGLSVVFALSGCGKSGGKTYTVEYSDGVGTYEISVKDGEHYTLEHVPDRYGYDFEGWFDSENSVVKYVDEEGQSTMKFSFGENLVLYPRFTPKEYTLHLDYQGATATAGNEITVKYDSDLSVLPVRLTLEYQRFTGWYTEPNEQGVQVADADGALENVKVSKEYFDFDNGNDLYLYAGFKGIEYDVNLYFENSVPETIKVEHGTDIKDIVYQTRINQKGVLYWSTESDDTQLENVFLGKITGNISLYAVEYAPIITFDEDGGSKVPSIVARAGEEITLPTPERENYRFIGWQDSTGNAYSTSLMPENSVRLKAKWLPVLTFDENGGTAVADIVLPTGTYIELPTPKKEGFLFAGWYTEDNKTYATTSMPSEGIQLKAGWYRCASTTLSTITEEGRTSSGSSTNAVFYLRYELTLNTDFYEKLKNANKVIVGIEYEVYVQSSKYTNREPYGYKFGVNFVDSTKVSSYYWSEMISDTTLELTYQKEAISYTIENPEVSSKQFQYTVYANTSKWYSDHFFKNHKITLTIPDTTNLYL